VEAGGSNPFASDSSTCRDGRKHPGLLEGGTLRGVSSERRPWSVRRLAWVSPHGRRRAGDSGCPEDAEEGNVVAHAHRAYAPTHAREIVACARQTRPSLGPSTRARQSSLHTGRQKRLRGGANAPASRLGKPARAGRTNTGVGRSDAARLAACHRFRKGEGVVRREKEGGRGLPPCEDQESRVGCSHVVVSVAEVCRRHLASNKLGKRAPKRAVRVE
jgi:hypothetical protein